MTAATERDARPGPWHRRSLALWSVLGLLVVACGGSGGSSTADVRTAGALIGPQGGTIAFPPGRNAGVSLTVPPGAVLVPTQITIEAEASNPRIVSMFPVYRVQPRGLTLALPATVSVRIGDGLVDAEGHSAAVCFQEGVLGEAWQALLDSEVDDATQCVRARTQRLGDFVAWSGGLHRLTTQEFMLLDPAVPTRGDLVGGLVITIPNGGFEVPVGRGSLASFWSSPASDNVLIVPGLLGSPLDFLGSQDLPAALGPGTKNIVLLAYPTGRGVAATANWLYDEIRAHRQPGFGCTIVGHSMGGLIGRYLLEQSADDTTRAGWQPTDAPLTDTVTQLVLLGVPNAGSEFGDELVNGLLPNVPAAQRYLLQAVHDISYQPDAIALRMNAAYVDNATRYHVLYGDLGSGTDGVVTVASALALPLVPPESAWMWTAQHDQLHVLAASLGIVARIDLLLSAP